ncbi:hypothetical protein V2J09_021758 [Rumex salicifolius]
MKRGGKVTHRCGYLVPSLLNIHEFASHNTGNLLNEFLPSIPHHRANKGMVRGLPSLAKGEATVCSECLKGKQHRDSMRQKSLWRASKKLELIHTDICGPISPTSSSQKRYIICFIDDFSRKAWFRFLASKGDAFNSFKIFKQAAEKETGEFIKRLKLKETRDDENLGYDNDVQIDADIEAEQNDQLDTNDGQNIGRPIRARRAPQWMNDYISGNAQTDHLLFLAKGEDPKSVNQELMGFSDSDYAGYIDDRKHLDICSLVLPQATYRHFEHNRGSAIKEVTAQLYSVTIAQRSSSLKIQLCTARLMSSARDVSGAEMKVGSLLCTKDKLAIIDSLDKNIEYWRKFVAEFFDPDAKKKGCVFV